MVKLLFFCFIAILASTTSGYRRNGRTAVGPKHLGPYYQYQVRPQMRMEDSDRVDMYYKRVPISQYKSRVNQNNSRKRTNLRKNNYYQNNRKQDFGFGNRFRQRVRTTTGAPKKYGPRPLAVFN